jgi:hypothetical protein
MEPRVEDRLVNADWARSCSAAEANYIVGRRLPSVLPEHDAPVEHWAPSFMDLDEWQLYAQPVPDELWAVLDPSAKLKIYNES